MNDNRGLWFILGGLILGSAIGVLLAWSMPQAEPVNTSPASLRADFRDDYRFMIASAYSLTGDLGRARARLATLADADPVRALGEQAQRMLAQNSSMERVSILANLSQALQARPGESTAPAPAGSPAIPLATSAPTETPLPQETPTAEDLTRASPVDTPPAPLPATLFTATLRPTRTATATPGAPFALSAQEKTCDPQHPGLLQINLEDAAGQPVPGTELVITWFGGQEHFYSGFKNEISPGYADYTLTSGLEYALSLSGGGTRLTGLIAPVCTTADGKDYPGSIRLAFKQP